MTSTAPALARTPFYDIHTEHKGRMVEYAGWELPITYGSIIDEHKFTRSSGGFFDVSHMGRLRFSGRHARRFLDRVCTRQIFGMEKGQIRYSLVCNEKGGCRDDVLVYCIDDDEYLMVCNAANREKLLAHFAEARGDMVFKFADETKTTAMCAIQGPKVIELISKLSKEVPSLKRYRFTVKNLMIIKVLVSRTGYTGEDGVEVILPSSMARLALGMVLKDMGGESSVIKPVGLGARDTLRLEAGMPLYGHEMDEDADPISAGLSFGVKLDKGMAGTPDDQHIGNFIGQEALRAIAAAGPTKKLVGLHIEGRRAARQGARVFSNGVDVGVITSGCLSPTLDRVIAMAYVPPTLTAIGTQLEVNFNGSNTPATVAAMPFVSTTR